MLNKLFKLKENNTTVKTEVVAGITTFMTMAYILAVNPSILSAAGMSSEAVLLATCLASFLATILMGFLANLPFALSAGMGLNAFLAYTVCGNMGYSWKVALLAVFVEGIIFIILSLTNVREAIFNSIPLSLKNAVSVGIGLFIAFIGLQNAKLVVGGSTLVELVDFTKNFSTVGIGALLAVVGTLITAILYSKKVKGAILYGILITWVLGIICQLTGLYVPGSYEVLENGNYSLLTDERMAELVAEYEAKGLEYVPEYFASVIPKWGLPNFAALGETFGKCFDRASFDGVSIVNFIVIIFSFLFVDLFDTLGTLIGVSAKADMLDKDGKLPKIRPALLADAVGTSAGAVLGTSTVTTFVESASGVAAGGRTGLTAIVTGILFLISTLFSNIFIAIPSFATAPALIIVGFLMFTNIVNLKLDDDNLTSAVPAYLCIIAMPLFYSIAEGISIGVISYVVINLICKKFKEIHPVMYVLAVLFILKYIFL